MSDAPTPPAEPKKNPEGAGPVIAIVVIVLILVLGGIYYLFHQVKQGGTTDTAVVDIQAPNA